MAYISLETAKKHLNIEDDFIEDDTYITSLISTAECVVEKDICCSFKDIKGEGDNIPSPLLQAALLLIGTFYANRESVAVGVSVKELPSYKHLIALFRNYSQ